MVFKTLVARRILAALPTLAMAKMHTAPKTVAAPTICAEPRTRTIPGILATPKITAAFCAAALLAACGAPKPRPEHAHAAPPPSVHAEPSAGPGVCRIDAAHSELRLLVYRSGTLARLGHNHVIFNHAITGWVRYSGDPVAAAFVLHVPVADFVVDDAQMRSAEGADFSEDVAEDAKAGTRHNMLSAALLDGDHFPAITITSASVTRTAAGVAATLSIDVAGHGSSLVVPFTFDAAEGRLSGSGTVVLRQTALGLTPYSVMLGALQVQDEVTVKFKLVATAT